MAISEVKKEHLNVESVSWHDLTWVNIEQPTERETEYLAKNYPFHPLDLDDCLSRTQRPKIDEYPQYLFIVFHFQVYNKATRISTHSQVSVFIGEKYLITLHTGQLKPLRQLFRQCQTDEESRQEYFSRGSGYLLYRILDALIDDYFPVLDKILSLLESVEDKVFDENVEAAVEVATLRRDIVTQRRIALPMRAVFGELETKLQRFTKIDMRVYFGDLIDHMNKICDTLDECKEIIEIYKDSDFILSADRLNRIMRVLTVMSTILLPFLVVSSIYGMNLHLPGGLTEGSLTSFVLVMLFMAVLTLGMLYYFRRKRWI